MQDPLLRPHGLVILAGQVPGSSDIIGDFSLEAYAELLGALREQGYAVRGFDAAEPGERHLVLRHDIDMSLDAALRLAEHEHAQGARATYFVLLRTEFYNPFSGAGRTQLEQIRALGHEVGLHFDAALYAPETDALEQACTRECRVLEEILGSAVEIVSFHRPAPALLGSEARLGGRRHTYEPRFFDEMGYCSDSRGGWHHGPPLEHPAVAEGRALQLLTHPIWWIGPPGDSIVGRLDGLARERHARFRQELAAHCEPYRDAGGGDAGSDDVD